MVNVLIYLDKDHNHEKLVEFLLSEKLIAAASIDFNNLSYTLRDNKIVEDVFCVITAQSKALLFNDIVKAVEEKIGKGISIVALPIVGYNKEYNELIKLKVKPI
jgi:uncharacterized protein involved in tolerance to divalent cations